MASADRLAAFLLHRASLEWEASGGPPGEAYWRQRLAFALRLCQIGLQHELRCQLNRSASPMLRAPALCGLLPPPPATDSVPRMGASSARLEELRPAPDGRGFRRLRRRFLPAEQCRRLRAASTVAMVQAISRGGQTVLSSGVERDARLGLSSDDGAASCLRDLLHQVQRVATDDLNQACAAERGILGASSCAAAPGAGDEQYELSLCGDLLVRLEPPEPLGAKLPRGEYASSPSVDCTCPACSKAPPALGVVKPCATKRAAGCWRLAPRQPYWDVHVDKHNVSSYDVSAVLYLASSEERVSASHEQPLGSKSSLDRELPDARAARGLPSSQAASPAAVSFRGGGFSFHDADVDVVVLPEEGSLLTFSSDSENPHSVTPVEAGCRFALVAWFTKQRVSTLTRRVEESGVSRGETATDSALPHALTSVETPSPSGDEEIETSRLDQLVSSLHSGNDEAALRCAAECCLASNDPARTALLQACASGQTSIAAMEAVLKEEGGHGHACLPSSWVWPREGSEGGMSCRAPDQTFEASLAALVGEGVAGVDGEEPLLSALVASVHARMEALKAAQAAASGATLVDDMFDVFD